MPQRGPTENQFLWSFEGKLKTPIMILGPNAPQGVLVTTSVKHVRHRFRLSGTFTAKLPILDSRKE